MVSEAIREIKEAEKEAQEAQRRARAEGKQLIARAHEASEQMLDEMRREVRDEEKTLIERARVEAEGEASTIAAGSESNVDAVREEAGSKVDDGVELVLESILKRS